MREKINIPISSLEEHPDNHIFNIREDNLEELIASVAEVGVLQPLLVKKLEGGLYRIIAGHRRKRAAEMAGIKEVPCVIMDNEIDEGVALVETNLRVRELSVMEKARAVRYLKEKLGIKRGRPSGEKKCHGGTLMELFNESRRSIIRYDNLNNLIPELQDCIERGILGLNAGERIAGLPEFVQRELYEALGDGISDIGPEEVRALKEQNERGYLVLEVMQRQLRGLEEEVETRKELQGDIEELEKKINKLRGKKKQLEYDLLDHENAVKTLQNRAIKKGAALYTVLEEISRPVASAKPVIEMLIEQKNIDPATATHLLKWAKLLIEVGQIVEKTAVNAIKLSQNEDIKLAN